MEHAISEVTRRNILDIIMSESISWCGRLTENEFLNRVFNLRELPSTDARFHNMEGDVWQHRVNNPQDWDDRWVFSDSRLNILHGDDGSFLKFLCQMVHPVVRDNTEEAEKLVSMFNEYLSHDGVKLVASMHISGKAVYEAVKLDLVNVEIESKAKVSHEFVTNQFQKCDRKLDEGDFDGAVTNARSLVEGVLGDIYKQCTGETMPETGDLRKDYAEVKKLLNLSDVADADEALKTISRGLAAIVHGIDSLSNDMGDRHRPIAKPDRRHARLAVNAAKTLVEFLYDTVEHQRQVKQVFLDQLVAILGQNYGKKRRLDCEELHNDTEIKEWLSRCDVFLRNLLKEEIINKFGVHSFHGADVFFACMRVLINELTPADVQKIIAKGWDNDQMVGMDDFIDLLREHRPVLMGEEEYGELQGTYYREAKCMRGMYARQA